MNLTPLFAGSFFFSLFFTSHPTVGKKNKGKVQPNFTTKKCGWKEYLISTMPWILDAPFLCWAPKRGLIVEGIDLRGS